MPSITGPYPLDGVAMPAWLIPFDKRGACTAPETRRLLLDKLARNPPSDIVLFSHGWNEDFDGATLLYAQFMRQFEAACAAHAPDRPFDPLFVGVLWPSIWMTFDSGPQFAGGSEGGLASALLGELSDRIAATAGTAGLERLYALLNSPSIDDADAAELASLIAPAFGVVADERAAAEGRSTAADDVLMMMREMESAGLGGQSTGSSDLFDFSQPADSAGPDHTFSGARAAGFLDMLDPRNALRLFSLFQMKDRAGTVGFNGVAALLRDLLAVKSATGTAIGGALPRIHAVGHSFGCKVLLSAICAQPLPRPVASLLLLQPAISHLAFADVVPGSGAPGGYRAALSADRVAPPIISTYTRNDRPLHDAFHLAMRRAADLGDAQIAADDESTTAGPPPSRFAALGGYGPRRAGQVLVDPLPSAGSGGALFDGAAPIVAFDGSRGLIKGHGDIAGPEVVWALHRLAFRTMLPIN